jgi:hypothetical protein
VRVKNRNLPCNFKCQNLLLFVFIRIGAGGGGVPYAVSNALLHLSFSSQEKQVKRVIYLQCSAVQSRAEQCSTVQYSAVQCSAVQCSAVQCSAVQCSAVQCNTVIKVQ